MASDETNDLELGVGKLRWSDSEADVLRRFPVTRKTGAYEGRDPQTGEVVSVPVRTLISGFRALNADVQLDAVVEYGPDGITSVDLISEPVGSMEDESEDRWPAAIAAAAVQLGRELGVGPVSPDEVEQEWVVQGCRVELSLESDEFMLTIHRPA